MPGGEAGVLVTIIVLLAIWAYFAFQRWLHAPPKIRVPLLRKNSGSLEGELPDFLRESGYEVLYAKIRIPVSFDVDGQILSSRYYIDAIVRDDDEFFVVKVAKSRQALEWTGADLRDKLLPYALICQAAGVIYVNMEHRLIKKITFELD